MAKYCNESICARVCLSVCPRAYLPNYTHDLYQFFVNVAYLHGSVVLRRRDKITSGMCIMFTQQIRSSWLFCHPSILASTYKNKVDNCPAIGVNYLLLTMTASSSLRACCSSSRIMLCSSDCAFSRFCNSENCSTNSSRRSSIFYKNSKSISQQLYGHTHYSAL